MAALARLILILFVVLTVIYVSLSLYSRSKRRARLERTWDNGVATGDNDAIAAEGLEDFVTEYFADPSRGANAIDREGFIKAGLADYDDSLRRKLILGVYVVPILLIGTIIYFTNFN
ncbi:hypothetical protein CLV78_10637 [Aliiruegeria haliotis]|uniref:Uncharacterized protein n=1 Tax=Aliiruegeria haliotis TaxID=1280846 RepID=A0A2T0RMZ0_9RHOB|nr:hypothetical protein [Aliiruegeria haliotis]PRY22497.1 hypothetical protein CLV78_10637 [Aliiruegeria haliotis]